MKSKNNNLVVWLFIAFTALIVAVIIKNLYPAFFWKIENSTLITLFTFALTIAGLGIATYQTVIQIAFNNESRKTAEETKITEWFDNRCDDIEQRLSTIDERLNEIFVLFSSHEKLPGHKQLILETIDIHKEIVAVKVQLENLDRLKDIEKRYANLSQKLDAIIAAQTSDA